uniref:Kinocilin n=1 Tax=Callorhinchus milii TaxID=7868 RepID=A0A4W3GPJ0_CALMI
MNAISINEYHCLRVSCAVLSIVAGCIIIGVSSSCGAEAVGGIFLGAGALGLMISIFPFIRAWLDFNQVLPFLGNLRIHPGLSGSNPSNGHTREGMVSHVKQELPNKPKYPDKNISSINLPEEGTSAEGQQPDVVMKRKFAQQTENRLNEE